MNNQPNSREPFRMFSPIKIVALLSAVSMTGCANMGPAPVQPVRPVLSCDDCSGLKYYGPQVGPAPDPRVQMASVIVKGITSAAGIAAGAYAATDIASTIAGAGKTVFAPGNTTTTTTTSTIAADPIVVRPEVVAPVVVNPEVVNPTVVNPEIVNPVIVQP